jgi:hypothetical protein
MMMKTTMNIKQITVRTSGCSLVQWTLHNNRTTHKMRTLTGELQPENFLKHCCGPAAY